MQFDINNVIMQEFGIARGNMNVQDVSGNKCDNVSPHLPVASFTYYSNAIQCANSGLIGSRA